MMGFSPNDKKTAYNRDSVKASDARKEIKNPDMNLITNNDLTVQNQTTQNQDDEKV